MKKLFFLFSLLMCFSIGQMWSAVASGTTYEVKSSAPTGWTSNGEFSTSGGGFIKLVASTNYIQTDEFCQGGFTSIKIKARKFGGPDATQGKIYVDWYETGASTPIELGTVSPSGTSLADLTISSPSAVTANKTGYIKISCKGASSSKGCGVSEVTITYTAGTCGGGTPTCAKPTFSPEAGSYEGTQNVTITSTSGATIYYTTDGSTPSTSSSIYSAAIPVAADMTIKAYAVKAGSNDSEVAEAAYTITEGPDVTLDFTTNTVWQFPTSNTLDEGTFSDGTYTIKVKGEGSGKGYKFSSGKLLIGQNGAYLLLPEFANPIAKIVCPGVSGASGSVKWNVYDGETAVSTEVTGCTSDVTFEIEPKEANKQYKIRLNSAHNLQISHVKIYFGEEPAVAKPIISGLENFVTSTEVGLTCSTEGATIYYTTDGSNPKTSNTKNTYSAAFTLSATTTIKAAAKVNNDWSNVAEKTFTKVTPMTVAQALNVTPAINKCVKGVVATITEISTEHGNATYTIKDEDADNSMIIYRGLYLNNTAFTTEDQIYVGDEVTIFGTISEYQSVNQFAQGNYIVALKPAARLAWSAESFDASLEGANTFPSLTNTNSVSVSYSSSNTSAATISNEEGHEGEISLVAVGSTTITASFAGNETYKAKSVSYTLNVASSLVTLTYNVDGGEAIDPVNVSALPNPLPTTTKAGKNFGGWFTDSQKTVAAVAGAAITENTTLYAKWLDPYTVAEAKAVIDGLNGGTKDNQYVAGIISQIDSYSSQYHSITYWISADGTTTNQLEVYSGKGLNSANFSAVTDLELGDEVVVTGTLKKYNDVYEFDKNNYLYSLSRKASAGLEYATTAVNKAVGDDAFINPLTNPNSVAVTYATSDDQVAEVANDGTVTIVGEGSATITASFAGNETYSAAQVSYTLTVSATPVVLTDYYEKVTSTANITDGTYLIVYEEGNVAFNGGLETLDAVSNTIAVEITNDKKIGVTEQTAAATFHIDVTAGTIKSASNKYIGVSSNSNGLKTSDDASTYSHTFSIDDDGNAVIAAAFDGSTMSLRYNTASNQARFRYYKDNGQQAIQLYKLHGEVVKPAAGLAWDPADDIVLTVGDEFTAPTLLNPNNIATADIAIASDNEDLATVSNGVVSLVADATGTATITATFAGNDNYKAGSASYTITVNAAASPASGATYSKVTSTSDITDGEYLIVYEATSVAFNGALETLDAEGNSIAVTISEGVIAGTTAIDAAVFTIDVTAGTLQSASGYYIGVSSNSNGLKQTDNAETYTHTFSIDDDGNAVILANFEGSTMKLRYNPSTSSGNLRFRYYKNDGQQAIQLYKKESAQPVEPEPVYDFEEVRSGLEVGRHYTICLEKKIVAVRGATFWGINNCSEDNLTVYLEMQQPPFDAGKPFIFHATAETLEVAYEGDAVGAPITNGALRGTFSYMAADALAAAGSNIYMMYNNALHPLGTNNHLDAHRAYLLFDALVPGTPAPGRTVRSMPMHGNVTTDIEDAEASAKPMKKLIDGQLFIQCGEKLYDATGRQVK